MSISQSTIMEDIWETIEGILDDITTDSINWTGSWPADKILSKSSYPIGVIEDARILSLDDLNLSHVTADTSISVPVTIYDTNTKQCNQIVSDVLDAINDNKTTLESAGLFFDIPLVASTDSGMFMQDGIKIHWISVDLRFKYTYQR